MQTTVRQSEILRLVQQEGACSVASLADALAVSGETIRRNVKPLVAAGLVRRVHGGIMLPDAHQEPPINKRMRQQMEAKKAIAARLAEILRDGDSLLIDTGSTTSYIAQALSQHKNLMVVTNSSYIGHLLAPRNGNQVFLAGGELRAHDAAAFGPSAIAFVRQFQVRYAVLSMGAIHEHKGCTDFYLCEAEFSRAVIEQCEEVIVAADATKFGRAGLVKVCDLDRLDVLVTDRHPPAALAKTLGEANVRVEVANLAGSDADPEIAAAE